MRTTTFKISEELLEMLDKVALKLKITRSEAIRRAIIEFVIKYKTSPMELELPKIRIRRVKV